MSTESSLPVVARTHGVVGLATCACLLIFYAGAGPFGVLNDLGNALLGSLSLAIAWLFPPLAAGQVPGLARQRVLLGVAAVGAVLTVVGTVLVVSGATGYYLAGLWSSFGFGLIGIWLLFASRLGPARTRRAGLIAGGVMMVGLIGGPGILKGIDDMDTAPVWTFVAGLSWAGTYLLFPTWTLRLTHQTPATNTP